MSFRTSRIWSLALAAVVAAGLAVPVGGADATAVSPPGANDWSCQPTVRHPFPVVLVEGTFESMAKNWATMSPYIKSKGYCVFALNYGTTNGVQATGPIAHSAHQLRHFVNRVLTATSTTKVDLVGHSQGGMMPRYYMRFLGGAAHVNALIGIAPSNHGTTTMPVPPPSSPLSRSSNPAVSTTPCQACTDQMAGSAFLTKLNAGRDIEPGPFYTVISTTHDEVVTPYTSQALAGPSSHVTNVIIQNLCPLDPIEHDQTPNDPVVQQLVSAALARNGGPLSPGYRPSCS